MESGPGRGGPPEEGARLRQLKGELCERGLWVREGWSIDGRRYLAVHGAERTVQVLCDVAQEGICVFVTTSGRVIGHADGLAAAADDLERLANGVSSWAASGAWWLDACLDEPE